MHGQGGEKKVNLDAQEKKRKEKGRATTAAKKQEVLSLFEKTKRKTKGKTSIKNTTLEKKKEKD